MKKTRRNKSGLENLGCLVVILGILMGQGLMAQTTGPQSGFSEEKTIVYLSMGQSQVVNSPWPSKRVAITDPKIADVQVLTPTQFLLQGKEAGNTDLIIWNEDEKQFLQMRVHVVTNLTNIKDDLDRLFPDAQLELIQSDQAVAVKGLLRRAEEVPQLHQYLETAGLKYVDMTSVAGIQQVQLQVRMAEVTRSCLRVFGMNAFYAGNDFFGGSTIGPSSGGAFNPINIGPSEGAQATHGVDFNFNSDVTVSPLVTVFGGFPDADLEFFVQALAENQYFRVLANPTLVALSGQEANFLAGGEYPIPVSQTTSGGGNAITIEYKEFGVRLKFRPTVLGDGNIRLYVAPEVSELTNVGSFEMQGYIIPGLTTRRSETTIELKSGQTFAMAGLLRKTVDGRDSRVPLLGDLPILGSLFRSTRYNKGETELVMLVTANLVEPLNKPNVTLLPGFQHQAPNDWEFYVDGRIESKEPAKIAPHDAALLKEMGLDRLIGPGAWENHGQTIPKSQADSRTEEDSTPAVKE